MLQGTDLLKFGTGRSQHIMHSQTPCSWILLLMSPAHCVNSYSVIPNILVWVKLILYIGIKRFQNNIHVCRAAQNYGTYVPIKWWNSIVIFSNCNTKEIFKFQFSNFYFQERNQQEAAMESKPRKNITNA